MSQQSELTITYIGGPTALIEFGGLRFLTDPTLDPAGTEYPTAVYTLKKTIDPAVTEDVLASEDADTPVAIDAVLLSHDHHFDNLDNAGRDFLAKAARVLTTADGAGRLGGDPVGLAHWETFDIEAPHGRTLRVTATPARHGPEGGDRGPVIGFVLAYADRPNDAIYISGDTVWYEGVEEVAKRFDVAVAVLFMGAAKVAVAGPHALTMTAEDGVNAARSFKRAAIIPLHFEGWEHFTESRAEIEPVFAEAGVGDRLIWLEPGAPTAFSL